MGRTDACARAGSAPGPARPGEPKRRSITAPCTYSLLGTRYSIRNNPHDTTTRLSNPPGGTVPNSSPQSLHETATEHPQEEILQRNALQSTVKTIVNQRAPVRYVCSKKIISNWSCSCVLTFRSKLNWKKTNCSVIMPTVVQQTL